MWGDKKNVPKFKPFNLIKLSFKMCHIGIENFEKDMKYDMIHLL